MACVCTQRVNMNLFFSNVKIQDSNLYCFNNHTGHFDKDNLTNMATQLSTVLYTIKTKYTQYKLRTLRHENIMTLITRQSVTGPQFTRPSSMMPSQDPTGSHPCGVSGTRHSPSTESGWLHSCNAPCSQPDSRSHTRAQYPTPQARDPQVRGKCVFLQWIEAPYCAICTRWFFKFQF